MTQSTDNVEEVFPARMEAEQQQLHGAHAQLRVFSASFAYLKVAAGDTVVITSNTPYPCVHIHVHVHVHVRAHNNIIANWLFKSVKSVFL